MHMHMHMQWWRATSRDGNAASTVATPSWTVGWYSTRQTSPSVSQPAATITSSLKYTTTLPPALAPAPTSQSTICWSSHGTVPHGGVLIRWTWPSSGSHLCHMTTPPRTPVTWCDCAAGGRCGWRSRTCPGHRVVPSETSRGPSSAHTWWRKPPAIGLQISPCLIWKNERLLPLCDALIQAISLWTHEKWPQ